MKTTLPKNIFAAFFFSLFLLGTQTDTLAQCTASFFSIPDSAGTGVSFVNTSTGTTGSTSYSWSFGDGSTATSMNPYHQYTSGGWYLVCLAISDSANGCSSVTCDSVYSGGNGVMCQSLFAFQANGLTVTFLNQSIGINLNYHWDFGDGLTSNNQNATHSYLQAGQYLVCLTVSNANCSDTSCLMVNVTGGGGGNCQASFVSADSAGVTYFFNTSTGSVGFPTYVWDFGDGSFGYNSNEAHMYNSTGAFLACLTVTYTDTVNQTILCTSTYCDSVNGGGGGGSTCQAAFNWMYGTGAGEINFTDFSTASDSISGWIWDFNDGSTSTQQNPTHFYAQTGTYHVCLTITATNLNGTVTCTNTWCSYIQVQVGGGGCQASFVFSDSAGTFYFFNTSTGTNFVSTSYYWDFGDGFTSSLEHPQHAFNTIGPYYVCLTISDSTTGCFDTYCDSVFTGNGANCQAAFNAIPDSTGFGYSFINASSGTGPITSYTWSASDGTSATGASFQHTFTTQGWYQVCLQLTVYDSLQNIICTSIACDSVYAGNGGGSSCTAYWGYQSNQFISFFADLSYATDSIVSWMWDFGDGTTSTMQNPIHTYSQSGYYNVCLTIETANGGAITCTDTWCQTIYAGPNTVGCQANFSMVPDSTGYGFQFQNISTGTTGSTVYVWSFGDGGTSSAQNPNHLYSIAGSYTVCLTISDSSNNCSSTYCDSIQAGPSQFCDAYFVWSGDSTNGVQFYQFNNNLPGITYNWDFGDGDSSNVADPYHTYASAAAYYACLTVTQLDSNGLVLCISSYCDSVFAGSNANFCAPQITAVPDSNGWGNGNVNFLVSSPCGNVTSVNWDFGDGTSGTGVNATHQYSATGWYLVCVEVEINGVIYTECENIFALRLVGVNELPNRVELNAYPNPVSSSLTIAYSIQSSADVAIVIYDIAGREVLQVLCGYQFAGIHSASAEFGTIGAGIYLLKMTAGNASTVRRIVVSR